MSCCRVCFLVCFPHKSPVFLEHKVMTMKLTRDVGPCLLEWELLQKRGCPHVGKWLRGAPAVAMRMAKHQVAPHTSGRWQRRVSTWMARGPGLCFLSCPGAPPALQPETRQVRGTTGCSDHLCLLPTVPGQPFVLARAGCVCIHT